MIVMSGELSMRVKEESHPYLICNDADRDLERRVLNYLAARHVPGLRHLAVEAFRGAVTIRGRVRTFYEKQLCNESCRRVAGVIKFIDDVEVVPQ